MQALYAELPHVECKRLCRQCCGPVVQSGSLTRLEFERIADYKPSPPDPQDFMACSMLDGEHGTCRVYELRPMICRLWGVVPSMRCPYGCEPERWLTEDESRAYMRRAEEIGGEMNQGPEVASNWILRTMAGLLGKRTR